MAIRFQVNEKKALEALVWLLNRKPGMTRYVLAKVLYYADKLHLQRHGRPVIGDRYIAMEDGMVPSRVLDMLERDPKHLFPDEIDAIARAIEETGEGEYPAYRARREPELDYLSRTDVECLGESLTTYGEMDRGELWRLAHDEPAWGEAWSRQQNSEMDYSLIIDQDHPKRELLLEKLRETAGHLVF